MIPEVATRPTELVLARSGCPYGTGAFLPQKWRFSSHSAWWLFPNLSSQKHPRPQPPAWTPLRPLGLASQGDINLSLRVTKV